jgi:hypothetical protein
VIPYTLHPEVEAEIDATATAYDAQQSGLGASFVAGQATGCIECSVVPPAALAISHQFRVLLNRPRIRRLVCLPGKRPLRHGRAIFHNDGTERNVGSW